MRVAQENNKANQGAFSLVEILAATGIVAVLLMLGVGTLSGALDRAAEAKSASNLRQLALATQGYTMDSDGQFFRYRENTAEGVRWYFGYETKSSLSLPEGSRSVDRDAGPLAPYIQNAHWVTLCPGFLKYRSMRKPKYGDWVTGGYGVNVVLTGGPFGVAPPARMAQVERPSETWIFGTCAQVNTFQAPASVKNPMLEEFYYFDQREVTVHFRFGGGRRALFAHLDGSVRAYQPLASESDKRMEAAHVGRVTRRNDFTHLR